jgi:hypothetical protein
MQGKTKGLLGCGGCGCLTTILLVVGSFVLPAILFDVLWDISPSLAGFTGLGFQASSGLCCLVSTLCLIVGIVFMMKDKKAAAEDDE